MGHDLVQQIAGEITMSENTGATLRKWRVLFEITQKELARLVGVSPSVISDYESGRRASPGITSVRRIVNALLEYDESHGFKLTRSLSQPTATEGAILGIKEYSYGVSTHRLLEAVEAEVLVGLGEMDKPLYGFTLIDSLKAITTFNGTDFAQIYGWSNERALCFTGVKYGRSPLIAIRAHHLKPALVLYIQPERVDILAKKLSKLENIILARTELSHNMVNETLSKL